MRSSFGRFGILKKQKNFEIVLSGRRKIGLLPAGVKAKELIAKHVHARGFLIV